MKDKLTIIKVGGAVLNDNKIFKTFLNNFSKIEEKKILVHGGGIIASNYMVRLGIPPKFIKGRRITDEKTLDVAIMTYAGLINKKIVAQLQKLNCNSIGLSGADCNLIKSKKREIKDIDFGLVGDITKVNVNFINNLIKTNIHPVICSLSHDGNGQLLNTNADTIASELAIAFSNDYKVELYYCFEKKGVLQRTSDENSVIKKINNKTYIELKKSNIINEGMIPKLDNCFYALDHNVSKVCIGQPNMLFDHHSNFTTIQKL